MMDAGSHHRSKEKPKSTEKWLMTRKTWRYMSSKMSPHLSRRTPADDQHQSQQENLLETQAQLFQEVCGKETEFYLLDTSPAALSKSMRILQLQESNDSDTLEAKGEPHNGESGAESSDGSDHDEDDETDRATSPTVAGDHHHELQQQSTDVIVNSDGGFGTQTEDHLFFDLDWSKIRRPSTSSVHSNNPPEATSSKEEAHKNAKPVPVFSDAVLKYFGMGRKKSSSKNPIDFRSVNYDRNLRNIKSKNENRPDVVVMKTCDFGFQEGQSFIGFNTSPSKPQPAEVDRLMEQKPRPPTLVLSPSTPKSYKRSKSSTAAGFVQPNASAPPSPPKTLTLPCEDQQDVEESNPNEIHQSFSLPLSPTANAYSSSPTGLNFQSFLSAVMHKSKSGGSLAASHGKDSGMQQSSSSGHGGRLLGKKSWKSHRSKSQSRASASSTCIWTPQGQCTWTSITGRQVVLTDSVLTELTEVERITLQKVALAKLQALNMGVVVRTPPSTGTTGAGHKPKRRPYLLRKRAFSTGTFFDSSKKDSSGKECSSGGGQVFGIPIDQCVSNERERARLQQQQSQSGNEDIQSDNGESTQVLRKSSHGSRTSFSSLIEGFKFDKGGSCESLNADRNRRTSLSSSLTDVQGNDEDRQCFPLIPTIVTTCCSHLRAYGASKLGIFRVSSSKKRVRQLRESFDSGQTIKLDEECCPHDVATLLKEYFRDLPDPLLTRELYEAFVQTQRIRNRRLQMEALQHLVQLLPPANRDTLYCLLSFLSVVASKANDHQTVDGDWESGNKMDSNNLATLFAPNLLHTIKPGTSTEKLAAESVARAGERIDVINVIRCMIDHHQDVFKVSAELLDEVYIHMMDTHPEVLDRLLRRRCQNDDNADDLDTSSSVFEGSDCSSLKLPWTPGYDEQQGFSSYEIPDNQQASPVVQKLSIGNNQPTSSGQQTAEEPTHFRRRGDILHENGGTGGSSSSKLPETPRERRRDDRKTHESHRSTEEMTAKSEPTTSKSSSHQQPAGRGLLSRERSDPTLTLGPERKAAMSQQMNKVQHPPRSSSDIVLSNGLEVADRRLSSPHVGSSSGVITASLKISVGATASPTSSRNKFLPSATEGNKSFTVENDHEIPFIEDVPSPSSKQPPSSTAERTREPVRSLPVQQHTILKSAPWTDSLVARNEDGEKGTKESSSAGPSTGVVRSKTTSSIGKTLARSHLVLPAAKEEWLKKDKQQKSAAESNATTEESGSVKKKAKKKYVGNKNQSDSNLFTAMITSSEGGDQPVSTRHKVASVVHKRWNLIASSPEGTSNPPTK